MKCQPLHYIAREKWSQPCQKATSKTVVYKQVSVEDFKKKLPVMADISA